jgi:hypothetical protein
MDNLSIYSSCRTITGNIYVSPAFINVDGTGDYRTVATLLPGTNKQQGVFL